MYTSTEKKQISPALIKHLVTIIFLLAAGALFYHFAALEQWDLPLRFSPGHLLAALFLILAIEALCTLGEKIEQDNFFKAYIRPQTIVMIKRATYLISVVIAYFAYRGLALPYLSVYSWIYDLLFATVFLYTLSITAYKLSYSKTIQVVDKRTHKSTSSVETFNEHLEAKALLRNHIEDTPLKFDGNSTLPKQDPVKNTFQNCGVKIEQSHTLCMECSTSYEVEHESSSGEEKHKSIENSPPVFQPFNPGEVEEVFSELAKSDLPAFPPPENLEEFKISIPEAMLPGEEPVEQPAEGARCEACGNLVEQEESLFCETCLSALEPEEEDTARTGNSIPSETSEPSEPEHEPGKDKPLGDKSLSSGFLQEEIKAPLLSANRKAKTASEPTEAIQDPENIQEDNIDPVLSGSRVASAAEVPVNVCSRCGATLKYGTTFCSICFGTG